MTEGERRGARGWVRQVIRYGYFPLMAFGLNGVAATAVFGACAPVETAAAVGGLVVLALALSFGAEQVLPYDRTWNVSRGDVGRDVAHFAVNESMSLGPLLLLPLVVAAAPAPVAARWPTHWPLPLQLVLALVTFDLGQNLFHWASHTWAPLWRLHAVHHAVERMYGLNGIMKHPLYQLVGSVVAMAPLVLLGMPDPFALMIAFGTFVQLLLQHSNVDYRTGPLRRVFATAEVHRFHHLRGTAGDVNFALFFSAWDHVLGNAYDAARRVGTPDIGLDDRAYPQRYVGQLLAPFVSRGSGVEATS